MRLILTYHSLHASGWSYAENDHLALALDLDLFRRLGYQILPLSHVVSAVQNQTVHRLPERCVTLTCDDGVNHDVFDFYHPDFGLLLSFKSIIERARASGQSASMTSFVISSATARRCLDETCIAGRGEWTDDWWHDVASLDFWDIACHSWDHNHESLEERATPSLRPGTFLDVEKFEVADIQVADAARSISRQTRGLSQPWFAYPYGHFSEYLVSDYLPRCDYIEAAFTTEGTQITNNADIYAIPRLVCGQHWRSPAELISLID